MLEKVNENVKVFEKAFEDMQNAYERKIKDLELNIKELKERNDNLLEENTIVKTNLDFLTQTKNYELQSLENENSILHSQNELLSFKTQYLTDISNFIYGNNDEIEKALNLIQEYGLNYYHKSERGFFLASLVNEYAKDSLDMAERINLVFVVQQEMAEQVKNEFLQKFNLELDFEIDEEHESIYLSNESKELLENVDFNTNELSPQILQFFKDIGNELKNIQTQSLFDEEELSPSKTQTKSYDELMEARIRKRR